MTYLPLILVCWFCLLWGLTDEPPDYAQIARDHD